MKYISLLLFYAICYHTVIAALLNESDYTQFSQFLSAMLARESPSSVFPAISHPYPPIYADTSFKKPVPTNSWISNLFYPSTSNLAPTTPDPYILRLLDDFGGNPGLSISQPSQKVNQRKEREREQKE